MKRLAVQARGRYGGRRSEAIVHRMQGRSLVAREFARPLHPQARRSDQKYIPALNNTATAAIANAEDGANADAVATASAVNPPRNTMVFN